MKPSTVAESKPTKESVACEVAKYRKYTKNQVDIATLMYNNPGNKYRQRLLMVCCDPIVDWHNKQNRTWRSASESIAWEIDEMAGSIWEPLKATIAVMSDASKLHFAGLQMDFSAGAMVGLSADDPRAEWNGEQAHLMGSFIIRLLSQRVRRLLPLLRGWPRRCVLGLDGRYADGMLKQLQQDWENYQVVKARGDKFSKTMVHRSLFESAHVAGYMSAFEESGFRLTPLVLEMLKKRHSRVTGTQLAEDGFNVQRRAEAKGSSPIMSAGRLWSTLIDREVLGKRHRFAEVDLRLQPEVANIEDDVKIKQIVGHKRSTTLHSPGPATLHATIADLELADLELADFAAKNRCWEEIQHCWPSCSCRPTNMLIKKKGGHLVLQVGRLELHCRVGLDGGGSGI